MKFKEIPTCYYIAEVGHNHQGDIEKAKKLFDSAKKSGANAVKLQKRDNKSLYTKSFYSSPYSNPNSYADTYGLHREFLEFDDAQYKELKDYAKEIDIDFFATPFDFKSLEFLEKLGMKMYKIASADIVHLPLQEEIAKTKKSVLLSTGGATFTQVVKAKENIMKYNEDLSIMQCTASYPVRLEDMNLNVIKNFKEKFPECKIGLSDHENGIDAGPIAYMLGARVFEKHFTLNRANKGTDHAFSLEPAGLERFIRNIERVKTLLGSTEKKLLENEKQPLFKMRKSIVAAHDMNKGDKISLKNLSFKSPGGGLTPDCLDIILNKILNKDKKIDDFITSEDIN